MRFPSTRLRAVHKQTEGVSDEGSREASQRTPGRAACTPRAGDGPWRSKACARRGGGVTSLLTRRATVPVNELVHHPPER
jgi:hypothetical protein